MWFWLHPHRVDQLKISNFLLPWQPLNQSAIVHWLLWLWNILIGSKIVLTTKDSNFVFMLHNSSSRCVNMLISWPNISNWIFCFNFRLEKHIENCHGPNAKKKKMKNGKPKTYPIPQYKGEPGKIPCPHCNRPLADEKQLESHIKRFIVNIILIKLFLIPSLKNHWFLHMKPKFIWEPEI